MTEYRHKSRRPSVPASGPAALKLGLKWRASSGHWESGEKNLPRSGAHQQNSVGDVRNPKNICVRLVHKMRGGLLFVSEGWRESGKDDVVRGPEEEGLGQAPVSKPGLVACPFRHYAAVANSTVSLVSNSWRSAGFLASDAIRGLRHSVEAFEADVLFTMVADSVGAVGNAGKGAAHLAKQVGFPVEVADSKFALAGQLYFVEGIGGFFRSRCLRDYAVRRTARQASSPAPSCIFPARSWSCQFLRSSYYFYSLLCTSV